MQIHYHFCSQVNRRHYAGETGWPGGTTLLTCQLALVEAARNWVIGVRGVNLYVGFRCFLVFRTIKPKLRKKVVRNCSKLNPPSHLQSASEKEISYPISETLLCVAELWWNYGVESIVEWNKEQISDKEAVLSDKDHIHTSGSVVNLPLWLSKWLAHTTTTIKKVRQWFT